MSASQTRSLPVAGRVEVEPEPEFDAVPVVPVEPMLKPWCCCRSRRSRRLPSLRLRIPAGAARASARARADGDPALHPCVKRAEVGVVPIAVEGVRARLALVDHRGLEAPVLSQRVVALGVIVSPLDGVARVDRDVARLELDVAHGHGSGRGRPSARVLGAGLSRPGWRRRSGLASAPTPPSSRRAPVAVPEWAAHRGRAAAHPRWRAAAHPRWAGRWRGRLRGGRGLRILRSEQHRGRRQRSEKDVPANQESHLLPTLHLTIVALAKLSWPRAQALAVRADLAQDALQARFARRVDVAHRSGDRVDVCDLLVHGLRDRAIRG